MSERFQSLQGIERRIKRVRDEIAAHQDSIAVHQGYIEAARVENLVAINDAQGEITAAQARLKRLERQFRSAALALATSDEQA